MVKITWNCRGGTNISGLERICHYADWSATIRAVGTAGGIFTHSFTCRKTALYQEKVGECGVGLPSADTCFGGKFNFNLNKFWITHQKMCKLVAGQPRTGLPIWFMWQILLFWRELFKFIRLNFTHSCHRDSCRFGLVFVQPKNDCSTFPCQQFVFIFPDTRVATLTLLILHGVMRQILIWNTLAWRLNFLPNAELRLFRTKSHVRHGSAVHTGAHVRRAAAPQGSTCTPIRHSCWLTTCMWRDTTLYRTVYAWCQRKEIRRTVTLAREQVHLLDPIHGRCASFCMPNSC